MQECIVVKQNLKTQVSNVEPFIFIHNHTNDKLNLGKIGWDNVRIVFICAQQQQTLHTSVCTCCISVAIWFVHIVWLPQQMPIFQLIVIPFKILYYRMSPQKV